MKNKSKSGISLIVLVITIIVMIILAGAIIVTLSNTGIMNKANQAVDVTDMKQIETLASTLWADAYLDGARTKEDLEKAVKDGLAANKVTEKHYDGYELVVTESGVVFEEIIVDHNGIIPEGGVYYVGVTSNKVGNYTGATAIYVAGDEFPTILKDKDVYTFGDYEYRYKKSYQTPFTANENPYWMSETQQGWGVRVLDKTKTSYGYILKSINNKNVVYMNGTFYDCRTLEKSPDIPSAVEYMNATFHFCFSLVTPPKTLPDGLKKMQNCFKLCESLESAPAIPSSVKFLQGTFSYCNALTGKVVINCEMSTYNDYGSCFALSSTGKDITLAGSCSATTKQNLANTSDSSYRKVYDEAGTLLK